MPFPSTTWLVDTSLRASVVIVLLLCLHPASRSWIGSRALAWLWLAVAVRLLFPLLVSGKPGFVASPYAPDAGYVDLRGFTRGQSVRDPYTDKLFLVP